VRGDRLRRRRGREGTGDESHAKVTQRTQRVPGWVPGTQRGPDSRKVLGVLKPWRLDRVPLKPLDCSRPRAVRFVLSADSQDPLQLWEESRASSGIEQDRGMPGMTSPERFRVATRDGV